MFLNDMKLSELVLKQYKFKLHAYMRVFSSLIATQLIAVILSMSGVTSYSAGTDVINMKITSYSADMAIGLTILWAFLSAMIITTKAYRFDDFAFVTTRLSSNLANFLFLLTTSVIGGVTAMLCGYLLKVILFLVKGTHFIQNPSIFHAPQHLLLGIASSILYILLFSALGYLFGILIQLYRPLIILLPVALIGYFTVQSMKDNGAILGSLYQVFFVEPSLGLFFIKVLTASILLFSCAAIISNRMEVRN